MAALLACWLTTAAAAQGEQYLLHPGDRLAISIAGMPESTLAATIGLDGTVTLPQFGTFAAAGKSLAHLQQSISLASVGRPFSFYSPAGERVEITLTGPDIYLKVDQFRPVYMSGAVVRRGPIDFFPGMSLRMALATAGGPSVEQTADWASARQSIDIAERFQTLAIDHASAVAALWAADATLARDSDLAAPVTPAIFVPRAEMDQLLEVAREGVRRQLEEHNRQKANLDERYDVLERRIALLNDGLDNQEGALATERAELERMIGLDNRGLTVKSGVVDARRTVFDSAGRVLDVRSRLAELDLLRSEIQAQIATFELTFDRQQMARRSELIPRIWSLGSRINASRGIAEIYGYETLMNPLGSAPELDFTLTRQMADGSETIRPDLDTLLMPGDVVDLEIRFTYANGANLTAPTQ
ncbi:polysaccharide biosynthesis/export family protein [Tropicimonas marinistellae]|uniref:polysaccharide biosynthesis/export family protein n=1 Tax=Tropicimonas marinistellae TaxID=1739787 RepID=UPI0008374BD3|nr:polysaccharide biosynthesis/export family protein [Tropicimonas marinistellae]